MPTVLFVKSGRAGSICTTDTGIYHLSGRSIKGGLRERVVPAGDTEEPFHPQRHIFHRQGHSWRLVQTRDSRQALQSSVLKEKMTEQGLVSSLIHFHGVYFGSLPQPK